MSQSPAPVANMMPTEATVTARTTATPPKRPASELHFEPKSEFDNPQHPSKRRANEAPGLTNGDTAVTMARDREREAGSSASHDAALVSAAEPLVESQLRDKDSEDLVELIMELQAAYMHNLETISAQYEVMRKELDDIKSLLATVVSTQLSGLEAVSKRLQDARPLPRPRVRSRALGPHPPPLPPHTTVPTSSAGLPSNPTPQVPNSSQGASRPSQHLASPQPPSHIQEHTPHTQPTASTPSSSDVIPSESRVVSDLVSPDAPSFSAEPVLLRVNSPARTTLKLEFPPDGGLPKVINYSSLHTVRDVWREYRFGMDGTPAIETLENTWQSRWRPDPRGRTWFSRRKIIWDKVKELIHDGLTEHDAVAEVEAMRNGRTMNWLINLLVNNRKEVKASWKAAAAAATAAKYSR